MATFADQASSVNSVRCIAIATWKRWRRNMPCRSVFFMLRLLVREAAAWAPMMIGALPLRAIQDYRDGCNSYIISNRSETIR
jgi:hypothetical protein